MIEKLKNISVVSLATLGSRVLGLIRDVLIFAVLGANAWSSAFILAFTLPNLFRRLFGEGALTSAIVPLLSDSIERDGKEEAFDFFNQVLNRLLVGLLSLVLIGAGVLWAARQLGFLDERWALGADFSIVLLPYMVFVCSAAIFAAALQVLNRFAIVAITPALLNLCMIASLLAAVVWGTDSKGSVVYMLCGGVLFGGMLQLVLPALQLRGLGWRPKVKLSKSDRLGELWALFLPGLIGAAILQINILVSRLLAYTLDETAVSVLYLASRLMELPLGIFTVAIITVFFPILAKSLSKGDRQSFSSSFLEGMRLILAVTIPAGIGLAVLAEPILVLLFEWGAFERQSVLETVPLLAIYGVGLPFYSIATFATRGLHAGKDMRSPVRVAAICLCFNVVASILFMGFWGASGLALANVLAAVLQSVLLFRNLFNLGTFGAVSELVTPSLKVLFSALLMGAYCWFIMGSTIFERLETKLASAAMVSTLVSSGALLYLLVLFVLRYEDLRPIKSLLLRKLP